MNFSLPATIETQAHIDEGLDWLVSADPKLALMAALVDQVPLRRSKPGFESLVKIIVGQQVSVQSADAIWQRLVKRISPLNPEMFIQCGETAWIEAGLSRPKQRALCALCEAIDHGTLQLEQVGQMPADEAIAHLTQVKGIGPWTAEVYLLFAVGHPDIFPAGDLALQNAARQALTLRERPDDKALRKIAESWAPWRGVAARLFWAYYAIMAKRDVMP
ncbi:MAG: DNA-3-methyladenine glycosylase [Pseudomonadota bacterium]